MGKLVKNKINVYFYIVGGMSMTELRILYVMKNVNLKVLDATKVGTKGAIIISTQF